MDCDIVRDLLPLYAEDMASEGSRAAVEAHLKGCAGCREALLGLGSALPREESAALPLYKIKRGLKARRLRIGALVALIMLALLGAVWHNLTTPRYAAWQRGLVSIREIRVEELLAGEITPQTIDILAQAGILDAAAEARMGEGAGSLMQAALRAGRADAGEPLPDSLLEFTLAAGYGISLNSWGPMEGRESDIQVFDLRMYTYPFVRLDGGGEVKMYQAVGKGMKAAVFYLEPNKADRLVYGPDPDPAGGRMTLPRLALAYYVWLALGLALAITVLLLILRKHEKARKALVILLGLPLSWLAGHLLIMRFSNESWDMLKDVAFILGTAALMLAAWAVYWRGRPGGEAG